MLLVVVVGIIIIGTISELVQIWTKSDDIGYQSPFDDNHNYIPPASSAEERTSHSEKDTSLFSSLKQRPLLVIALILILIVIVIGVIIPSNSRSVKIVGASIVYNPGIGNDWQYYIKIDGYGTAYKGRSISVDKEDLPVRVTVFAEEWDESSSDIGTDTFTLSTNTESGKQVHRIGVHENRGRGAGGTAQVDVTVKIR